MHWDVYIKRKRNLNSYCTVEKSQSKVDGFTFAHFCPKVITSDVKVLNDLLMLYVRRYYLLANQPSVNIRYFLPINSVHLVSFFRDCPVKKFLEVL